MIDHATLRPRSAEVARVSWTDEGEPLNTRSMLRPAIRRCPLVRAVLAVPMVVLVACLIVADWAEEGRYRRAGFPAQVGWVIEHGDRLHYVGHLLLGRVLDLCPCTDELAADQYDGADAHARTVRQRALVTDERPHTPQAVLSDFGEILTGGLRWGKQGVTWLLAGSREAPIRLMPLGDSLTKGVGSSPIPDEQGGYRPTLQDLLAGSGYHVTFVGSQLSGPASFAEQRHEGHVGQRIDRLAAHAVDLIVKAQPDLVLLMVGTTDLHQGADVTKCLDRLGALLDRISAATPGVEILVATLPPSADPSLADSIAAYNSALPEVINPRRSDGRRVRLVDVGRAVTVEDLADPIHPSSAGYAKMAEAWFVVLIELLPNAP
jgi:lysophospholipase L1-like esterase